MLFRKDAPIALLAEQDGLLMKKGESISYNAGCKIDADQDEIPWRFAHPEVAILWRLARRLSSDRHSIPADDPEKQAAESFITESPGGPFNPLPLFREALEAIERHPRTGSVIELLKRLRAARRE